MRAFLVRFSLSALEAGRERIDLLAALEGRVALACLLGVSDGLRLRPDLRLEDLRDLLRRHCLLCLGRCGSRALGAVLFVGFLRFGDVLIFSLYGGCMRVWILARGVTGVNLLALARRLERRGSLVALRLSSLHSSAGRLLLRLGRLYLRSAIFLHLHFAQLLLNLEPRLVSSDDAPLRDQLAVLVVEDHAHRVLEVLKLLRVDDLHLMIGDLAVLDQREQNVGSQVFHFQIKLLRDLALLEALVDAPDVLAQGRVVIVLDAVVAPAVEELGDVGPLVTEHLVRIEDDLLFEVVDWRLLDARVQMVVPALSALLSRPAAYLVLTGQLLSDERPPLGAVPSDQVDDGVVLRLVPQLALASIFSFLDVLPRGSLRTALAHLDPQCAIGNLLLLLESGFALSPQLVIESAAVCALGARPVLIFIFFSLIRVFLIIFVVIVEVAFHVVVLFLRSHSGRTLLFLNLHVCILLRFSDLFIFHGLVLFLELLFLDHLLGGLLLLLPGHLDSFFRHSRRGCFLLVFISSWWFVVLLFERGRGWWRRLLFCGCLPGRRRSSHLRVEHGRDRLALAD